jgi:MYXO-CTERM domain-containing protein
MAAIACMGAAGTAHATVHITTFDNGLEGWSNTGRTNTSLAGNPGACLDDTLNDVFGISIRNSTNPNFVGNLAARGGPMTVGVDIRTDSYTFFGTEVTRTLIAEFVDNTPSSTGLPYVSVWVPIGTIVGNGLWTSYQTPAFNPASTAMPAGWGAFGAEDASGNPKLPLDRTFASVMASVDEIRFSTFVPGYFFGFSNAIMAVDNPRIAVVPAPGALAMLGLGVVTLRRRRR